MILAVATEQLIFLIIAAAVGVINWWLERKKQGAEADPPKPTSAPRGTTAPPKVETSEQERLRRFLEALGVPNAPQQQPPPPAFQPAQPKPAPRKQPRPAALPNPVPRQARAEIGRRTLVPSEPTPRQRRPVVREEEDIREPGRLEEAASAIEKISAEFERMNVRSEFKPAPPSIEFVARQVSAPATVKHRERTASAVSVRNLVRQPADLRAAFVAMELLGPPKGLQS